MEKEILKLDDFGRGITYVDDKITFVPNTVPKDIIELEITKSHKKYNEGICTNIIKESFLRTNPFCPYFSLCGGCSLQNLFYDETLNYKKNKVVDYFKKYDIDINPVVILNETPTYYRNKISLKVRNSQIGFYQEQTHNLICIDKCMITKPIINKTIDLVKTFNIVNGDVTIRCNSNDETLISILTKDNININKSLLDKTQNIVLNNKTIYNNNYLFETVNGIKYKISYDSFFQVNINTASKLFKLIEENITMYDKVLDLYGGVGTLGLSASKKAKEVLSVEIVPNAVENAKYNAKINNINNARFLLSDASTISKSIDFDFDKLILDPPRSGLTYDVIDMINEKQPKEIIYVSCDYHTQVRDILKLDDYKITKSYIIDMFSYTYHVESVILLQRK